MREARHTALSRILPLACAALFAIAAVRAGGPLVVNGAGQPMAWDTAGPIVYNVERGGLGRLARAEARLLLADAFAEWAATGVVAFAEGSLLPGDVDGAGIPLTNSNHWRNFWRQNGDGWSPVIFDDDGSAIDGLFGLGARFDVLGIGGLDTPVGVATEITEGTIILNGLFYDGVGLPASPEDVASLDELKAVMVHEIGHLLNLDHSVVNHELAGDGDPDNDIYLPTMFPVTVDDETAITTLNPDDVVALRNLYDTSPVAGISGSVIAEGTPIQGAHVVLRKTDDPLMTAYGAISGGLFHPCNAGSACDPCNTACDPGNPPEQGAYSIQFVEAGDYTVEVEQIDTRFALVNNTFVGPLAAPPILSGPEEFHDAGESAAETDDPDTAATLAAGLLTGIDLLLNGLPTTDGFEPNDALDAGATLADLPRDTAGAVLGAGELDVYEIEVTAGQRVRIDVDAFELGSSLDAVIGLFDDANQLVATEDDAVDPDSGAFSFDPALDVIVDFTGTAELVVGSYPDSDLDGVGGTTTGGYWLRVEVESDSDLDGVFDPQDRCPNDADDDADDDGLCANEDNCPYDANANQEENGDTDGVPDACDNCPLVNNAGQEDVDMDGIGDACESCPGDSGNDPDGDGVCTLADNCPTYPNASQTPSVADIQFPFSVTLGPNMMSPDGAWMVYTAAEDMPGVIEIYSVPVTGGGLNRLTATVTVTFGATLVGITPDSSRVLFRLNGQEGLYSVPIAGGTAVRLDDPTDGDTIGGFAVISPDSSTVAYRQGPAGMPARLYAAPIIGGAQVELDPSLSDVGRPITFTPDSSQVLFFNTGGPLYSVPAAGGSAVQLSIDGDNGTLNVNSIAVTSDSSRVVYGRWPGNGYMQLYSAPVAGGSFVTLNAIPSTADFLVDGGTVYFTTDLPGGGVLEIAAAGGATTLLATADLSGGTQPALTLSPDGSMLVYRAMEDGFLQLFSVPSAGGSTIRLNGPVFGSFSEFVVSPDSTRVVYAAPQDEPGQNDIYIVPIGGGASKRLGRGNSLNSLQMTADSRIVVYRSYPDLLAVSVDGGASTQLNPPVTGNGAVGLGGVFMSGERVVYPADLDGDGTGEGHSAAIALADRDGDGVLDACDVCPDDFDPSQLDGDGDRFGDACDSCSLVVSDFLTDQDGDGQGDICDNCPGTSNASQDDADADGSGDACDFCVDNAELSVTLPFQVSPGNAEEVTFLSDGTILWTELSDGLHRIKTRSLSDETERELASMPSGICSATKTFRCNIDADCPGLGICRVPFTLGPDERTVFFMGDVLTPTDIELFSVPVAGGMPRRLNSPLAVDIDIVEFVLSDDGSTVAYVKETDTAGIGELFSVPGFGGLSRRLDDVGVFTSNTAGVETLEISRDGATAVYLADPGSGVFGYFSVPTDGSASPTLVNSTLSPGASVTIPFEITSDGTRLLYMVDEAADNCATACNLFAATLGVETSGVKLNPELDAGESVLGFAAVNDSDRVLYLADHEFDGRVEVFSARISDQLVTRISHDLDPGGSLFNAWVSPDTSRVVYVASQDGVSVPVLYSGPTDQPGAVPVSDPAVTSFADIAFSPDSSTIVYRDGLDELRAVSVLGGASVSVGGPPPTNASSYEVTPDSGAVLYVDTAGDLYAAPITGGSGSRINSPLPFMGEIRDFAASPDGKTVVYAADLTTDDLFELIVETSPADSDGDGVLDYCDLCVGTDDGSFTDIDGDGVGDPCDNCPADFNPDQADSDDDGTGDACTPDVTGPVVLAISPPNHAVDVALSTDILLTVSEPVDAATATGEAVIVSVNGVKISGDVSVSPDGSTVVFDPDAPLAVDADHVIEVTALLRDLAGNSVAPVSSTFDTTDDASSGTLPPESVGDTGGIAGRLFGGTGADDNSGFATAAVGNVTDDPNGISDFVIGAPNADVGGNVDAGKVTLVVGEVGLQSNAGTVQTVEFLGGTASEFVGKVVARAGDVGSPTGEADGIPDLLIGAPDAAGAAGRVYVVFGSQGLTASATYDLDDLSACNPGGACGVVFDGEAAGDRAGASIAVAGDVNDDGVTDFMIGSPDADVGAEAGAGKVYLIYGPLGFVSPASRNLSTIGSTVPGLVLHGEAAGDGVGAALSAWRDPFGIDDLVIGAPNATVSDESGNPLSQAGIVYAILGGADNLDDTATPGVIALSRVANGQADEVTGTVFLGAAPGGQIGRSVTGAMDIDDDGTDDVVFSGSNVCFLVPGDGPKGIGGVSRTGGPIRYSAELRVPDGSEAIDDFGAVRFVPGLDGDLEGLNVGPAGDINNDGVDDFLIGAPSADPGAVQDAGKAYVIFGDPLISLQPEVELSEIGRTRPGLVMLGFEAGDRMGSALGGGFDLNGDGVDDALIGAPFADSHPSTPNNAGETYLISPVSPEEVVRLLLERDGITTTLEWTVTDRALGYNVYRGDLSLVTAAGAIATSAMCAGGSCQIACGINNDADMDGLPDEEDNVDPPSDDGFVYLVTGENLLGEGPLGRPGQLPARVNDDQCP